MAANEGLDEGVGDSVDIAQGFKILGMSISSLSSSVKALAGMRANFGNSGSGPQSGMVDGGDARAGQITTADLEAKRLGTTPGGLYAPQGAILAAGLGPAPQGGQRPAGPVSGPSGGLPPQGPAAGGWLRNAGQQGFNALAGQPQSGGWGMGPNGPTYQPPQGPPGAGGNFGGTGSSGGLYGGLMASAQRMPVIGQALGIVDEIQSQRQKNAFYQNVEGGNNAHGFGERWNEALGSFTTMGMFAPGEYSDLYKNVTKLGYNDRSDNQFQSRKGAIDFAYTNKRELGMDASESAKFLTTASQSATASFGQLGQILEQVSASAAKAGVNTNMARAQFDALWKGNLANGLTGSSAMQTAGATATFQAGMGRQFAGTSFSGATSVGMNYMVASTNGTTYNQFLATANKNPGQAAMMREKTQSMGLDSLVTSEIKGWIKSQVQAVGGPSAIEADKTLADTFWPDFLSTYPGLDWNAVKSILQTFSGATFASDTDAFEYLVQWVMGKDANQTLIQQSKDAQIKGGKTKVSDDEFGKSGLFGSGGNSGAANAYKDWSGKNNKSDPVIESMLKGFNSGGYDQNSQKVGVVTSQGRRVVSLTEAVTNFSDQLASGRAQFVGGALDGKDASTFGALDQSASRIASAKAEQANSSTANIGQSLKDYQDATSASGSGTGSGAATNVVIGLTPQAAQIFNVQSSGQTGVTPNALGGQSDAARLLGAPAK
jgi:hypothetical protein